VLGWLFKRLVAGKLRSNAGARSLQVMDVLPLGSKQRLAVVRCYDRTFALGLGEKEIALIAELDAVIAPAGEAAPARADSHAFKDLLERLQRGAKVREPKPRTPAAAPAAAEYLA
jgi:flagellar biogenesis protein FliO